MKANKFLIILIAAASISFSVSSCKKCKGDDPRARIINNGPIKASVQIQTSGGNTVNINNVDPGTASAYSSYAEGQVTFTIKVSNVDYQAINLLSDCYDYDIAIDSNNVITTVAIDRNK